MHTKETDSVNRASVGWWRRIPRRTTLASPTEDKRDYTRLSRIIAAATFATVCGLASAETVTLSPVKDTYVQDTDPTANFGLSEELWLGKGVFFGLGKIRGLVEFDLTSLPADPNLILSATFWAYEFDTEPAAGAIDTEVHRITSVWDEALVTWDLQPSFDATVWSSAGVGDSFNTPTWIDWEVTTLVKDHVAGTPNLGWMFKVPFEDAGVSRLGYFWSSEYSSDPTLQPYLEVNLVPEPASFALVTFGALALLSRRR